MKTHVETFYHLAHEPIAHKCCQGTACLVARHLNPKRWQEAIEQEARVYCLGKCYMSPSSSDEDVRPRIESHAKTTVLLDRVTNGGARTFTQYGAYAAL